MDGLLTDVQRWSEALAALRFDLLGELLLASVLGGLVGWDREAGGKPAGLRTNMLICIGATLLADLSVAFASKEVSELVRADPARLAAQIVSGIGFLGAGTIIQSRGNVTGLTTAATLWVVAAIGIGVGAGHYVEAVGATLLVLVTLLPLRKLEDYYAGKRKGREVRIEVERAPGVVEDVESALEERGLSVRCHALEREGPDRVVVTLEVRGEEGAFREARRALMERPDVHRVRVH